MKTRWNINKVQHDDRNFQMYDYIDHVTTSGPTCEDLGIPRDDACALSSTSDHLQKPSVLTEFQHFAPSIKEDRDPFSPRCMIPLPTSFGMSIFDSPCFRRRNERERDRVRCVNEGYLKLKQHLPIENKDKRLSKVDTLRCAIKYIKYLQNLLNNSNNGVQTRRKTATNGHNVNITEDTVVNSVLDLKFEADLSEDDFEFTADSSDFESKCDTSSEADISE